MDTVTRLVDEVVSAKGEERYDGSRARDPKRWRRGTDWYPICSLHSVS